MDNLIKGLQILRKYGNPDFPTHCEHDELTVCINPNIVSDEDIGKLDELGFIAEKDDECFISFRFGSC